MASLSEMTLVLDPDDLTMVTKPPVPTSTPSDSALPDDAPAQNLDVTDAKSTRVASVDSSRAMVSEFGQRVAGVLRSRKGRSPHTYERFTHSFAQASSSGAIAFPSGLSPLRVQLKHPPSSEMPSPTPRLAASGVSSTSTSTSSDVLIARLGRPSYSSLSSSPHYRRSASSASPSNLKHEDAPGSYTPLVVSRLRSPRSQSVSAPKPTLVGPSPLSPMHSREQVFGARNSEVDQGFVQLSSRSDASPSRARSAAPMPVLAVHPERLRAEVVTLRADVSRLSSQVAGLESDLSSARERAVDAEARGRMLTRRIFSIEADNNALQQELSGLRKELVSDGASKTFNESLSGSSGDSIRAEVGELRSELLSLGRDLAIALKSRDEAKSELVAIEATLHAERGSASSAAQNVVARAAAAAADVAAKHRIIEDMRAQLSSLRAENDFQQSQLASIRSDRDSQLRAIEVQAAAAKNDKEGSQRVTDDLRSHVRALESQLAHIRADKERMAEQSHRSTSDLQGQLAAIKAEKEDLQRSTDAQYSSIRAENDTLQMKLDALQHSLEEAHARFSAAKSEKDSIQRSFESQLASFKLERDSQVRSLESHVSSLRAEKEALTRASDALQHSLDVARGHVATIQAERDSIDASAAHSAASAQVCATAVCFLRSFSVYLLSVHLFCRHRLSWSANVGKLLRKLLSKHGQSWSESSGTWVKFRLALSIQKGASIA